MSAMQFGKTDINIQNKIHTMKMTKTKLAKGFTLVELLVVIAIIAALAALSTPVVLKQQKKANATEAINNAKQQYLVFFEHDQDTGAYPNVAGSSNANFQKLITDGYTSSEEIFYAKTASSPSKPDGDTTGTNAAVIDEVGFLYIGGLSSTTASTAPLTATPQKTAGNVAPTAATFDENAFGGTAVVLFNDGSARTFRINTTNNLITNKTSGTEEDIFLGARLTAIGGTLLNPL